MDHALALCRIFGQRGSHDWSTAVASDTNGNFFVSGQTDGNLFDNFSGGSGQDIWVAKFDGSWGSIVWSYQVCWKRRAGMGDGINAPQYLAVHCVPYDSCPMAWEPLPLRR